MADKAMLTNRIVLRSIMPLFKILHEEDDTLLKHFLTRFEGVIQLAVKGTDIGAHIELKDRKLDVVQGIHPNPDILLPFKHISGMNALFTGGIPVFGGFHRRLARLGLLTLALIQI